MNRELAGIELVKVEVPLRRPWSSAAGTLTTRESLLARVVFSTGEGWGECAALPWPTYSPEYTDGAMAVAERYAVPALLAGSVSSGSAVAPALGFLKGHNMLKAGLEMAFLDAELRAAGKPLAVHLARCSATGQPPAGSVPAGVSIGLKASTGELVDEVASFVDLGYRRVKLKILPGSEGEMVAAVRRRWPGLTIMVDANGAYAPGGPARAAEQLAPLGAHGVACVEQPLSAGDLLGHAHLARLTPLPICLDESLTSAAGVSLAIEVGACSVVNIKAGRLGGYLEAVKAHDICAAASVPAWCGGMVETGLGRAANVALASLSGFTLPGDISGSSRFFDCDVAGPVELSPDGTVAVPSGPGLGVEMDVAALGRFATARSWHPRLPTGLAASSGQRS